MYAYAYVCFIVVVCLFFLSLLWAVLFVCNVFVVVVVVESN